MTVEDINLDYYRKELADLEAFIAAAEGSHPQAGVAEKFAEATGRATNVAHGYIVVQAYRGARQRKAEVLAMLARLQT